MAMWYLRDATWWNNPDRWKPKKYHLLSKDGAVAACSTQAVLDTKYSGHNDPPEALRCKRCSKKAKTLLGAN